VDLLKAAWGRFSERRGTTLAAAIGYRAIFALAPLLVVAVSGAGLIFGDRARQGLLTGDLVRLLGSRLADDLETLVASAADETGAGIIGTLILVWAASGLFNELQGATSSIYGLARTSGFRSALGQRLITLAAVIVMVIGFVLLVSVAVLIPLTGSFFASLGVGLVLFGTIAVGLRFLTTHRPSWATAFRAALVTFLAMGIAAIAVGVFVAQGNRSATAIAGSAVAVLLLVYTLAAVFLLGASLLRELELRAKPPGGPGTDAL
jgi:membrane protein